MHFSRPLFWNNVILLLLAILLVYGQTATFDFINWDDDLFVYQEPMLAKTWQEAWPWVWALPERAFYTPLSRLSYLLDGRLFGLTPGAMHLVNVAWHGANVVLLYLLFLRLALPLSISLLAALLFAVHPQHVEAVAWIAERKEVMSFFFGLLALHGYLIAIARHGRPQGHFFWLSVLAMLLSLMVKPLWVTLPCLLLLLDYWPLARPLDLRRLVEKWPYWLLTLGFSWLTLATYRAQDNLTSLQQVAISDRLQNALVAYGLYIKKALLPLQLSPLYPLPQGGVEPAKAVLAALLLLILSVSIWQWRKRHPSLLVGWLWFLGTLFPVSGLVNGGQVVAMADRWSYLPHAGLVLALAGVLPPVLRTGIWRFMILLVAVFAMLAWHQTGMWQSSQTLWQAALKVTPSADAAPLHLLLARHYQNKQQLDLALEQLQLARSKDDKDVFTLLALIQVHEQRGHQEEARALLPHLLTLPAAAPQALFVIGMNAFSQGDCPTALAFLAKTRESDKQDASWEREESLFISGLCYLKADEVALARPLWQDYFTSRPALAEQRCHSSRNLLQQKEFATMRPALSLLANWCR